MSNPYEPPFTKESSEGSRHYSSWLRYIVHSMLPFGCVSAFVGMWCWGDGAWTSSPEVFTWLPACAVGLLSLLMHKSPRWTLWLCIPATPTLLFWGLCYWVNGITPSTLHEEAPLYILPIPSLICSLAVIGALFTGPPASEDKFSISD